MWIHLRSRLHTFVLGVHGFCLCEYSLLSDSPSFDAVAGVPVSLPPAAEKRFVTLETPLVLSGLLWRR